MAPFEPFERWAGEPSRRRSGEYQELKERLGPDPGMDIRREATGSRPAASRARVSSR